MEISDFFSTIGWPVFDRFRIGDFAISPHGIGIALGYLAGAWWMLREGPKRGMKEEHIGTIVLWALIGAIFGARFFFVIAHLDEFESIADMAAVWRGGITLLGGITGAILFAYPWMRKYKYRFTQVMDAGALGLAFGIIIGRIGDLVIADHLGKPTSFFLGFSYESGTLPGPWQELQPEVWGAALEGGRAQVLTEQGSILCEPGAVPVPLEGSLACEGGPAIASGPGVHQTALYDFLIAIGLFALLYRLARRGTREGVLIATFAIVYGAGRIVTDFLRVDKTWPLGLTGSQWAAALAIGLGLAYLLRVRLRPASVPAGERVEVSGEEPETRTAGEPETAREEPAEAALLVEERDKTDEAEVTEPETPDEGPTAEPEREQPERKEPQREEPQGKQSGDQPPEFEPPPEPRE